MKHRSVRYFPPPCTRGSCRFEKMLSWHPTPPARSHGGMETGLGIPVSAGLIRATKAAPANFVPRTITGMLDWLSYEQPPRLIVSDYTVRVWRGACPEKFPRGSAAFLPRPACRCAHASCSRLWPDSLTGGNPAPSL